jgi:hypothetical protein
MRKTAKTSSSSSTTLKEDQAKAVSSSSHQRSPTSTTTQKRDDGSTTIDYDDSVEEMPMDERMDMQKRMLALCNGDEAVNDTLGDNLCSYGIQAMGEMCGLPANEKEDPNAPPKPRTIPKYAFRTGVQEHTSIEVEYVEPRLRQPPKKPVPVNTTKRNILLANISEKAREGYQQEQQNRSVSDYPEDELMAENMYASFSPPEKRKFVSLINLGSTPKEATIQVLKERKEGEAATQEQANQQKQGMFGGEKSLKAEEEGKPSVDDPSFAKSGINYYDAVRKADAEGYGEEEEEDMVIKKKKKRSIFKFGGNKKFNKLSNEKSKTIKKSKSAPAQPSPETTTRPAESRESDSSPKQDRSAAAAGVAAGAVAAVTLGAAAMAMDDSRPMTDEELLRDLATPVSENERRQALGLAEEKKMEDEMAAQLLAPMAGSKTQQQKFTLDKDTQDLNNLETYINSTDLMSTYQASTPTESQTVASGRTMGTTGTAVSTRSRRPGAAQKRLEAHRSGEIRSRKARPASHQMRGWQETMQQAAAENNRTWDPQHGWVDYADPNAPRDQEVPVQLPTPSPGEHRGKVEPAAGRQGWVESMKAASAKLVEGGQKWDPELGWIGITGVASAAAAAIRRDDDNVNTQDASDTADFGSSAAKSRGLAPGLLDTEGQDEKLMIYEDENSHEEEHQVRSSGRYMQIGDSGSVNSHYNKKAAAAAAKNSKFSFDNLDHGSPSRRVPKLRGPKRDTSPVSGRKNASPSEVSPVPNTPDATNAGFGTLSQMWESRSSAVGTGESATKSSEWKAILKNKMRAEGASNRQESSGARDHRGHSLNLADPNLSPIRRNDDGASDVVSEASTAALQPTTFMGKLQACAAPLPAAAVGTMSAHLGFLQKNPAAGDQSTPQNSRFTPPGLCGRPDVIQEEDDNTIGTGQGSRSTSRPRSRSRSTMRSSKSDVSSVISDEMSGSKAAFLESMAMKAVVSSSKKNKRRSAGSEAGASSVGGGSTTPRATDNKWRSAGSEASSSPSDNKWQQFLDKKRSENNGSVSGARSQASTSVSRAAEKYASKKVEEMMETQRSSQSSGGKFQSRPMEEATGAFPKPERINTTPSPSSGRKILGTPSPSRLRKSLPFEPQKSESQKAAEVAKAERLKSLRESLTPKSGKNHEAETPI